MARSFTDTGTATSYVGKASAVSTAIPLTYSCWVNSSSFTNFPALIQVDDGTNTNLAGLLISGAGNPRAQSTAGGTSVSAAASANAATGSWQHVAAVFASSTSRAAYLNGGNKGTNATSSSPAAFSRSSIGSDRVNGDGLTGSLAWVGIWKIALSDQDIANLGQGIHPLKVRPDQLVGCVDFVGFSPEPDRVSSTGWTVGGTGTTAVANSPSIFFPRNSTKFATKFISFGGSTVAKVVASGSFTPPSFAGAVTAKVVASGAITVGRPYVGNVQPAVIASGAITIGRPFIPNQTLRIQASGSFTVIRINPIVPPSTGYYVFLEKDGAYLSDLLTGGLDYSFRIQSLISGPYPDQNTAFQALWTFLNLPFPFANPLPPPPPGPWTNR